MVFRSGTKIIIIKSRLKKKAVWKYYTSLNWGFLIFLENHKGMSIAAPPQPSCSKTHFCYDRGFFYKIRYGFWNSELVFIQGHPTTVFSEISEFSIAWGRLEISIWSFQLRTIFDAYLIKSPRLSQDAVLAVFRSGFVSHFYFRGLTRSEQ